MAYFILCCIASYIGVGWWIYNCAEPEKDGSVLDVVMDHSMYGIIFVVAPITVMFVVFFLMMALVGKLLTLRFKQ